jgi:hypothetical protein
MVEYIFEIEKGEPLTFRVDIRRQYSETTEEDQYPSWTKLGYHQCDICPLPSDGHRYCPTAVDLQDIVERFSSLLSHGPVTVRVKTLDREYVKTCDIQTGLQSLLGLIMATSACPILSKLGALANFHLPFATTEDTLFRSVGAYLIRQYFIFSDGGRPDFELRELKSLYNRLEELNFAFSERIRVASKADANLNAMVQLGALSFMVYVSLEDQLKDFRNAFESKLF